MIWIFVGLSGFLADGTRTNRFERRLPSLRSRLGVTPPSVGEQARIVVEVRPTEIWAGLEPYENGPSIGWVSAIMLYSSCAHEYVDDACYSSLRKLSDRVGRPLGVAVVIESELKPKYIGFGYGVLLYRLVLEECSRLDLALAPNACIRSGSTSPYAAGAWAHLAKERGVVSAGPLSGADGEPIAGQDMLLVIPTLLS